MARKRQVGPAHRELQIDEAFAVDGFAGDDGNAEFVFEPGHADVESGLRRQVHHVKDEDDGSAQIENLMNEIKIPLEVRRIHDAQDAIGLFRIGAATEQHVPGDRFVGRPCGERISPGQIDDGDRLAVLRVGGADLLLHRDAGIIPDFLLQAGKGVKKRAFAAVRISDERVNRGPAVRGGRLDDGRLKDMSGCTHGGTVGPAFRAPLSRVPR